MAEAAITSKGQVTIPVEIRRQMNLAPKDRVVFTLLPNGTTIMRAKNRAISTLAGVRHEVRTDLEVKVLPRKPAHGIEYRVLSLWR